MIKIFILLTFLINFSFATENKEIIINVENYLNGIQDLQAYFIQDDLKHRSMSEGVFYLSRPNRLRIDYLVPFKANLYTDVRTTIYHDKELDEIHSIKTADTPLKFFLKNKISLSTKQLKILNIKETNSFVEILLKENKNDDNTLRLTFKKNPMTLSVIKVIVGKQQEIEMRLTKINNNKINSNTFNFNELKKRNKKK